MSRQGQQQLRPQWLHILLAGLALLIYAFFVRPPSIGPSDSSQRGDEAPSSPGELSPPLPRYSELSSSTLAVALQRLRLIDDQGGRLGDAFTRLQTEATLQRLLRHLQVLRVTVVILEPDQSSAQGEWNHRRREIRLHPRVLDGSLERFATTLQHEVLHTIQSCAAGDVIQAPIPIGLGGDVNAAIKRILEQPPYARAHPAVLVLEQEAFLHQSNAPLIEALLQQTCLPPTTSARQ